MSIRLKLKRSKGARVTAGAPGPSDSDGESRVGCRLPPREDACPLQLSTRAAAGCVCSSGQPTAKCQELHDQRVSLPLSARCSVSGCDFSTLERTLACLSSALVTVRSPAEGQSIPTTARSVSKVRECQILERWTCPNLPTQDFQGETPFKYLCKETHPLSRCNLKANKQKGSGL